MTQEKKRPTAPPPVLLAVDDEAGLLERMRDALERRYGEDYRVRCMTSPNAALDALEGLRRASEQVAVVLADQWMPGHHWERAVGSRRSAPPAGQAVAPVDWGAWGDRDTTRANLRAMAAGDIHYYVRRAGGDHRRRQQGVEQPCSLPPRQRAQQGGAPRARPRPLVRTT